MQYLDCNRNQLTSLDVSKNTALTNLYCYDNRLTSLEVSKNTVLTVLRCSGNQLTSLDVTKNTALTYLNCTVNQLTSLDVTKNTALTTLYCNQNQLTSLDVSKNTALTDLRCSFNQLTSLDVNKNTALTRLDCNNNSLTSLDVKNGQNNKITTFDARNNPNLTCIQVDDASASHTGWQKDATASYSEGCSGTLSATDINKQEVTLYPNPVKEVLHFSEEVSNIRITDLSGRTVKQISTKGKSVNVANLANGVYIVTATTKAGKVITKKIVKE